MKKLKIAWGITGAGDKIVETLKAMVKINKEYFLQRQSLKQILPYKALCLRAHLNSGC